MRNINLHLSTPTSRTRILHWLIKHHSFRFYIFRVCQLWDWYKVFHRALWSRYKAVADWGFWQVVQRSRWLQSLRSARWCSSWQKCDGGSFGTTCEERWIFGGSLLLPSQRWNRKQPQVSSWNNFQRIFDKVGTKLYDKLFGCALVAPAPLPVSFISFLLEKENSNLIEQEVIDAVSQFFVFRTSDETFTFLHNLIPSWLTDKRKASRSLFVDRNSATQFFGNIIAQLLSDCINEQSEVLPSGNRDLFNYVLRFGVRFLCGYNAADYLDIVYRCLTSYQFIEKRIKMSKIEIYSFIKDIKLFLCTKTLDDCRNWAQFLKAKSMFFHCTLLCYNHVESSGHLWVFV